MRFKRLSWLTLIAFLFSVITPLASATPVMAADTAIDNAVAEIAAVYQYLDENDKAAIRTARTNLQGLETTDAKWGNVVNPLLTTEVVGKFNNSPTDAKSAIIDFVKGLGDIYYSSDQADLANTLTNFKNTNKGLFQTLFGTDITVDNLYNFLVASKQELPSVLATTPNLVNPLAFGTEQELIDAMPDLSIAAMRNVLNNSQYSEFSGKLAAIGWSADSLVAQQRALAGIIDSDNKAELALAKAAVRSQAKAYTVEGAQQTPIGSVGITLPTSSAVAYCKIKIMDKDATSLVKWVSSNDNIVAINDQNDQGKTVKLEAKNPGQAIITAYRDYAGASAANDWILRFTVNVNSGGGGGGGGGGSTFTGTTVTTSGGTVTGSGATIEIPANAMSGSFKVKIEIVSNTSNLPMAENLVSDVVEITKDKSGKFDKPVTITLTYDKSKVDLSKQKISLYWLDGQIWRELDNIQIDEVNGKISGEIDHFTKFAVLATDIDKATFPDIVGHWAEANIEALVNAGVITGYPDGTFKPNKTITRAEFATAVVKAFNLAPKSGKVFNDTANHWAKDYIATAAAYGYVSGYNDTTFGPNDLITREQMALLIVNATGLTEANNAKTFVDEANISDWAKDGVAIASGNNLITGYPDNTFKPKGNATRAEAVTILLNALTLE